MFHWLINKLINSTSGKFSYFVNVIYVLTVQVPP